MKRPPSLYRMLGGFSKATRFTVAGTCGAGIVLGLFSLPLWPAIVVTFVFSWAGEKLFPGKVM